MRPEAPEPLWAERNEAMYVREGVQHSGHFTSREHRREALKSTCSHELKRFDSNPEHLAVQEQESPRAEL